MYTVQYTWHTDSTEQCEALIEALNRVAKVSRPINIFIHVDTAEGVGQSVLDDSSELMVNCLIVPKWVVAALRKGGVHTFRDLTRLTEQDLLSITGIGKKSVSLIQQGLSIRCLTLKDSPGT